MATFVRTITPEEDAQLRLLSQSQDGATRRRALCILMSSQGKTTAQIGAALSVSERAARNGVAAFNRAGIESVPRAPVTGRPRRLADIPTEAIDQVVADSPRNHGIDTDYWSLRSLAAVLCEGFGLESLSADTLGREIRKRGLDWLQAKQTRAGFRGARTYMHRMV